VTGQGGGKRVSAATMAGPNADVGQAEAAMRAMDQRPIFMIRDGDDTLDAELPRVGMTLSIRSTSMWHLWAS